MEYTQFVMGGEIEHYLSLACDHGRLEDQHILTANRPLACTRIQVRGRFLLYLNFV
ncbi:hypothetical protein [Faecalibacterium sp. I3-3-33]|uniref:hypothetical protein n=1 Tax=Faecalibacterium sp. I3-3-33 TaxID=2929492 RepID=UPI003FA5A132